MFFKKRAYKVKLKGRSEVGYVEGQKNMIIGSEFMAGPSGMVIYSDSMKSWQPPFENEKLTDEDRERIKYNITEDLRSHGIEAEWV